jgi:hypothetical protein
MYGACQFATVPPRAAAAAASTAPLTSGRVLPAFPRLRRIVLRNVLSLLVGSLRIPDRRAKCRYRRKNVV